MPFKVSGGKSEDGLVFGNTYDKYGAANPITRLLMANFSRALDSLVQKAAPASIHEVGAGEGYWVLRWAEAGIKAKGSDVSERVIQIAKENARSRGLDESIFTVRSIYDLKPGEDSADLIVCCEALEHLDDPEAGLAALHAVANKNVILSVPREPLWRAMNMARLKYLRAGGNTPGHVQRWSKRAFVKLVSNWFDVLEVRSPLPWTMTLASKRPNHS